MCAFSPLRLLLPASAMTAIVLDFSCQSNNCDSCRDKTGASFFFSTAFLLLFLCEFSDVYSRYPGKHRLLFPVGRCSVNAAASDPFGVLKPT